MLMKALESMLGPVILAALEEGAGPTTSDRLSLLGIQRRDFIVFGRGPMDTLVDMVRRLKPSLLVLIPLFLVPSSGRLRKTV